MSRPAKPGNSVRGSRTGKPIMALLDLLGRRWALRVVWELRSEPLSFRALREACSGVSPTVLNDRTRELRDAALIELHEPTGFALTELGRELLERFSPLVAWSEHWADSLKKSR